MISKTKIERKLRRKTNPYLAEGILKAKKLGAWLKFSHLISVPRRLQTSINLDQIEKVTKEGDTVLIPGKVLGSGDVSKKIRIIALGFSTQAREKLKAKKCEVVSVIEEIKVNPKATGIRVLR